MGQLGSGISRAQIRLLRRLGVRKVVSFFDDDPAGEKAALRLEGRVFHKRGKRLREEYDPELDLRKEFLLYRVNYKDHWPSDPGAMSTKQIRKAVAKAERIT